ncbi:MAG TPA: ATP-dependent DNA ligase [Acidimicrobiia bacterium]|nr:ATP-dependent DNA ligase [Acidimicrobiia bacterium]
MLLADLVATSEAVASTRARSAKIASLAELLVRAAPEEIEPVVGFLVGEPRQGRIGVGWATVSGLDVAPAPAPVLTIADVDRALDQLRATVGSGSASARRQLLRGVFGRATAAEADFLRRLLVGELRQGALGGLMADAVARAASVPAALVRRAAMLSGDLGHTATVALTEGPAGLDAVGLVVGRGVLPMLAASAPDVSAALADVGTASVEWKLDGARIQVHRADDDVRIYTRNLNDVTPRLQSVAEWARTLPVRAIVLDGEAIGVDDEARPHAFQDTMSSFGRGPETDAGAGGALEAFFFDVLHVDGDDVIGRPLGERLELVQSLVGGRRIPGAVTASPDEAAAVLERALEAGHEGVMVKALDSTYEAGRRGSAWRKVKPVRTLDLVVLAAEWGHGRRRGWLSNLHLGARGHDGAFVMVGKTFKGLTDAMLEWQTNELLSREIGRDGITVHVRPELVVEVALDGVQVSTRYPGGVALRFARVRRYRDDKTAEGADPIEAVQALLPRAQG